MLEFFPEGDLIYTEENAARLGDLQGLLAADREKAVAEAVALGCTRDHALQFDLGGILGIMPREEVALTEEGVALRDIAVITRVGKPCAFLIDRVETGATRPIAYLSRRKAQEKCLTEYLDTLETGDILPAKVTHFEPFGAFCDIGCGVISLLSIDAISVSRISHPSDRFRRGEKILCAVKSRDDRRLGHRGRISLTHKELLGTWAQNAARFQVGETVVGMIRSVESYGIFIELAPNLAGLAEWREDVNVGDACSVYIKNIIPEKKKIKLVLIDTFRPSLRPKTEYFITEGNVRDFCYG